MYGLKREALRASLAKLGGPRGGDEQKHRSSRAVWGTSGLPGAPQAGPVGNRGGMKKRIRRVVPKWLWLQSGALLGAPGHPRNDEDIPVLQTLTCESKVSLVHLPFQVYMCVYIYTHIYT